MDMCAAFIAVDKATVKRLQKNPDAEVVATQTLDIDQSWHCIHYMLIGSNDDGEEPLSLTIFGGEPLGEEVDEEEGYDVGRLLIPKDVRRVAEALIEPEVFKTRYNLKKMIKAGVYNADSDEEESKEKLACIVDHYIKLVEFYRAAASRGDGVLISIA